MLPGGVGKVAAAEEEGEEDELHGDEDKMDLLLVCLLAWLCESLNGSLLAGLTRTFDFGIMPSIYLDARCCCLGRMALAPRDMSKPSSVAADHPPPLLLLYTNASPSDIPTGSHELTEVSAL